MPKIIKSKTTRIILTTQFEATHNWPNCPHDDVDYLRYPHRHIFHVTIKIPVMHSDRDIEFIRLKRFVTDWLREHYEGKHHQGVSCEMICEDLHNIVPKATYISVWEDNENGAELEIEFCDKEPIDYYLERE